MRARLRLAHEVLHRQGAAVLAWRTLAKCLSPIGTPRLLTVCEMDLARPLKETRARIDVEIRQATEAEVDALVEMSMPPGIPVRPDERLKLLDRFLGNFRRGDLCFVATVGREFVHSNWIHFQKGGSVVSVQGRFLNLGPDEAYMTDGFTPRRWRGYHIHPAVNYQMLRHLQRAGFKKAYTQLLTDNRISWRGLERVGWQVGGVMLSFRFRGGYTLVWRVRGIIEPWVSREPDQSPNVPAPLAPLVQGNRLFQ